MYQFSASFAAFLLIFLSMMFAPQNPLLAQEQSEEEIFVQIGASYYDYGDGHIDDYFNKVSANLGRYGILAHQAVTAGVYPSLLALFASPDRPYREFRVVIYLPNKLDVSPLILPHNGKYFSSKDVWIADEVNDIKLRKITTDLITGAGLYSLDRCADAAKFFQSTQQLIDSLPVIQRPEDLAAFIAFYQGNCALVEGRVAKAAEYYALALEDAATQFAASINLAWIYVQSGQVEEALATLESLDVIINESDDFLKMWLLSRRARLYAFAFDYHTALSDINSAIVISEGDNYLPYDEAELHTIRGEIHLLLYEWENARADFNQAVELDPLYADAYFQRGILHYTMIERSEAIADFEEYLALAPDGRYAEQAAKYIESLKIEIEASGD